MTSLQLKVAIATAELKSVTAAAKQLNISQPNASNCIKLLEKEIGFPIMLRTSSGASVTQKGAEFLRHARQILDENEKIMRLRDAEDVYRLRLGTANYFAAAEPFFTLCSEHSDDAKSDLGCFCVTVSEGIRHLIKRNLDIVAVPVMKHQITNLISECKKENIDLTSICEIPSVIMMRKGHPAASDARCLNITQGCDTMKEYPYVALKNMTEDQKFTEYNDSDFIQCSYKIFVDNTNVRLRVIESSNGFGFGLMSSYRMMAQFGLVSFPVRGVAPELFCLTLPDNSERREIREYINLLKKDMGTIVWS